MAIFMVRNRKNLIAVKGGGNSGLCNRFASATRRISDGLDKMEWAGLGRLCAQILRADGQIFSNLKLL